MESNDNELERIFNEALQRTTAGERTAYLDGACGGDLHLRARVDVLIKAHDEAEGFLEQGVVSPDEAEVSEGPGSVIGNFKLLQKIGEGGMGAVYMAEQQRPVQRKVALKIIKLGMDTKQVIARFEAERQALAMMDHPGIAKVLDAGATDTGRPYFVMELVRGVPIGEYCDTHNLSTRDRLKLFVDVCHALQHAHQKGIIHRDIKPSNVLVTSHDGRPVPKIIDFGVAKATNQRLTEMTLFTEYHQFIGTPEYMSPEQAEMSGLDIDTRSDVYSLGVLLYNLLTGTTPVDAKTLREAGYENMQRLIREKEATAPSTLISRMGDASTTVAKQRGTDPRVLQSLFRGDLDWIVMKALEKDRTRRYETVSAMADDVERHLKNEPVLAGRPSAIYKLSKFVRRNRVAVLAGSVAASAILVGLAAAVVGFWRARAEAERSQLISDTLQELLVSVDPGRAASLSIDVEDVLGRAREAFGDNHATVATALNTLAVQLHNSGDLDGAEPLYRESLRLWREIHGERNLNVALTLGGLGKLLRAKGEPRAALESLEESLALFQQLPEATELASCPTRLALAELLESRGEHGPAAEQYRAVVDIYGRHSDTSRHVLLQTLEQYASVLLAAEDRDELLSVVQRVYDEVRLAYDNVSVYHLASATGLGNLHYQAGRNEEALPYFREAIAYTDYDDHPYRMRALDAAFQILRNESDPALAAEADDVLEQFVTHFAVNLSVREQVANTLYLAGRLNDHGRKRDALRWLQKALTTAREAGASVADLREQTELVVEGALSIALEKDLAPDAYESGRFAMEELLADAPDDISAAFVLGALLLRAGDAEAAADVYAHVDELGEELLGDTLPVKHGFHALVLDQLGDRDSAGALASMMDDGLERSRLANRPSVRQFAAEVRENLDRRD